MNRSWFLRLAFVAGCLVSMGIPLLSYAYPIFYKCNAHRQLSDVVTGSELDQQLAKLAALPQAQQEAVANSLCQGREECGQELKQIVELARIDGKLAERLFEDELKRFYARDPSEPAERLDESGFSALQKIRDDTYWTQACHETMAALPPSRFVSGDRIAVYYPYQSEYTYVTGCRHTNDGWKCQMTSKKVIEDGIRRALQMGADPYVALAIGLMEGGTQGIADLTLDPIGSFGAMGCRGKQLRGSVTPDPSQEYLESFGNYHKISAGVIDNPGLAKRLSKYIRQADPDTKPGKSYYCQKVNSYMGAFETSAQPDSCCLEMDIAKPLDHPASSNSSSMGGMQSFGWYTNSVGAAVRGLTMEYLRQIQHDQLPGKRDPAYRLQHFNGFSPLMGGAEHVQDFRAGVNDYQTPTYGNQAMDFILNSLISNPEIRALVSQVEKELKEPAPPSILCMDVKVPGVFGVDSDRYFDLDKNAPRLEALRSKSWYQMTPRQKKVVEQELQSPTVRAALDSAGIKNPNGNMTMETVVKSSNGSGFSLSDYTFGQDLGNAKITKIGHYSGWIPSSDSGASFFDPKKIASGITYSTSYGVAEIKPFGGYKLKTGIASAEMMALTHDQKKDFKIVLPNGSTTYYHYLGSQGWQQTYGPAPKENAHAGVTKVVLANGSGYTWTDSCTPEGEKLVKQGILFQGCSQFGELPAAPLVSSATGQGSNYKVTLGNGQSLQVYTGESEDRGADQVSRAAKYYFAHIWPSRNTISKASSYSWAPLTDAEIGAISRHFENGN